MRRDALNAAVAEFDPSSIGNVICDVGGGEIGPKVGLTRQLMYEGPDLYPTIAERFRELDYSVTVNEARANASRPDGILVIISIVQPGDSTLGAEPGMYANCGVPAGGGVSVSFEERDVGTRPSGK